MKYLLTIPAKNEESTIGEVINAFKLVAERININLKIQVIDDNSTDKTALVAKKNGATVYPILNGHGLASAFRTGMDMAIASSADYIIHADADGQHIADDMPRFIEKIHEGFDLVLGNRLHKIPDGMCQVRYNGNILLSKIVSSLIRQELSDTQTGYRIMKRKIAEFCRITGSFTYTQEQIIRAVFAGFRVTEIPINTAARYTGKSRLVRSPVNYLAHVFKDIDDLLTKEFQDII